MSDCIIRTNRYHPQGPAGEESSSNATTATTDGGKFKSKEEAKPSKSKSKSGSSSSKKGSGSGGGSSSKHKSMPTTAAANNPLSLPLPMLPEFAQPFAFPSAVQLRPHFQSAATAASNAAQEPLIRLPTKPLDISEVSRSSAAPTKKLDTSPPPPKRVITRPFDEVAADLPDIDQDNSSNNIKRDNVVKVPPFSNRQRAIVVETNNNETDGKDKDTVGGSPTSKEQFAVLRYVALQFALGTTESTVIQ